MIYSINNIIANRKGSNPLEKIIHIHANHNHTVSLLSVYQQLERGTDTNDSDICSSVSGKKRQHINRRTN